MLGVTGILMGDVVTPDQAGIPFPLEDGALRDKPRSQHQINHPGRTTVPVSLRRGSLDALPAGPLIHKQQTTFVQALASSKRSSPLRE